MPEADAEGVLYKLSITTKIKINHLPETMHFEFAFLCGQNLKSRQKTKVEENGNPNPQNFCFHFPSPFRISTLVERSNNFREKKKIERKISFQFRF